MSYSHFFFIEENHCKALAQLFENKIDGQFIILAKSNGYCDIAQYNDKYQDIRVITVKSSSLDYSYELA